MGTKNLRTDWKTIGRSGPTIDKRDIKTEWLEQCAKGYDKSVYTAVVWPDHDRYINLGVVEDLRTVDNDKGGKDLQAIIAPNDFYLSTVDLGQHLFFSMELLPNFAGSGEYYMTGLAATDEPASLGTSMMLFTQRNPDRLYSEPVETILFSAAQPSLKERIAKFFNKSRTEDDDMADKKALEELQNQLKTLSDNFTEMKNLFGKDGAAGGKPAEREDDKKTDDKPDDLAAKFAALEQKLDTALAKFGQQPPSDTGNADLNKKLADFEAKFTALSTKLDEALKEAKGTKTKEFTGAGKGKETETDC